MNENKLAEKLADAGIREQIAAIILKAREHDIAAAEYLEKALAEWK